MNMFARFDENQARTLGVIKETKRYGWTDDVKTVYPPQTKFTGGIKILSGTLSEGQTVWIQIKTNVLSVLIWAQTVCKGYQRITKVTASKERFRLCSMSVKYSQFPRLNGQSHLNGLFSSDKLKLKCCH